jgi:Ca-activated chloride channel family protein
MKFIFGVFIVFLLTDPGKIGQINTLKAAAKKAYTSGDYKAAAEKYAYLVDSLDVHEDEVVMNMANAYFHLNDTSHMFGAYQALTASSNVKIKSAANLQMGVVENRQGNFAGALHYFKQALKADPTNEDARFNYEMVKKKLEQKKNEEKKDDQKQQDQEKKEEEKKDNPKENQNKNPNDQDSKDQKGEKNQEDKDQQKKDSNENGEKKEDKDQKSKEDAQKSDKDQQVPSSLKQKLEDMNMSEEKANMILDALKNQEVQYLQQNKRKATQSKDNSKPDW